MSKICTCTLKPNACSDPTVTGVTITITQDIGGTLTATQVDETVDTSAITPFAGVTFPTQGVGGAIDGVSIDASQLEGIVTVCFVDRTTACGTDVLNQCKTYYPLPASRFVNTDTDNRLAPNAATGVVDIEIQNYKGTANTGITANCEPMRIQIFLEDGTLYEEISTLDSCTDVSTWTSTLSGPASILTHSTGTITAWSFDKLAWATANSFNYRAILDGITDTGNLAVRTNAQELKLVTYVGGQGSTTCPTESTNPDNIAVICKMFCAIDGGYQGGHNSDFTTYAITHQNTWNRGIGYSENCDNNNYTLTKEVNITPSVGETMTNAVIDNAFFTDINTITFPDTGNDGIVYCLETSQVKLNGLTASAKEYFSMGAALNNGITFTNGVGIISISQTCDSITFRDGMSTRSFSNFGHTVIYTVDLSEYNITPLPTGSTNPVPMIWNTGGNSVGTLYTHVMDTIGIYNVRQDYQTTINTGPFAGEDHDSWYEKQIEISYAF